MICRFWQNGRPVEISYTRDGFNDVSDMIPSLVHAGTGAAKGKPVRLSFEDFDEEYRELFGGAGQKPERMLQSTALHEMMKGCPFGLPGGRFYGLADGWGRAGALMGSGWMLKGNGGEFLSCLSRLNWDIGSKNKAIACVKKILSKTIPITIDFMHDLFKKSANRSKGSVRIIVFITREGKMRTRSALLVASCVLAASVVTGGALNESVGADRGIPPNHPQLTKFSRFPT